jgi:hypothetical protein
MLGPLEPLQTLILALLLLVSVASPQRSLLGGHQGSPLGGPQGNLQESLREIAQEALLKGL